MSPCVPLRHQARGGSFVVHFFQSAMFLPYVTGRPITGFRANPGIGLLIFCSARGTSGSCITPTVRSGSLEEPIQQAHFVWQDSRSHCFPDLLNIQLESWESFLQTDGTPSRRKNRGLQSVFKMNFPVTDARENFLLEFVEYYVEKPKYSVPECEERD